MINERQVQILSAIVEEYIETAQPVASKTLVDKFDLDVSPATVRNDMAALEAHGLLRQPHTSAGRVPTEDGYRFYLKTCARPQGTIKICAPLRQITIRRVDTKRLMREMAQTLVKLSGETAVTSINNEWNHYAGLSRLFQKPEFGDVDSLRELSFAIDRFDKVMRQVFDELDDDVSVWIGGENPFGKQMASVLLKYHIADNQIGILGLVGPIRMDYSKNIKLLTQAKSALAQR